MPTRDESHIGALIEQQKRLNDLSDNQIVARATARGEKLGKSNIGRVAAGHNPALSRTTIYGLAAGLGVTPATVARAVLADMGIILTEAEADSETAVRADPTLPEQGRRLLLAMLAQIRADMDPVNVYNDDGTLDGNHVRLNSASATDRAELSAGKRRGRG